MAENRYCDIEAFLDTIPQYAGESGVVRAGALLEELGHPEKTLKIIHVAGSNGKGSVCAYLNRILIQHGFRTGLFTSPHLVDVRERIRIDNEMVSKSDFVQAFDRVHSAAKRLKKKNITLAYFDWLFGHGAAVICAETGRFCHSGNRTWRAARCHQCSTKSGAVRDYNHQFRAYCGAWGYSFTDSKRKGGHFKARCFCSLFGKRTGSHSRDGADRRKCRCSGIGRCNTGRLSNYEKHRKVY